MSEAKHTQGPWQVYADLPSAEPNWHIVTNASRMRVIANVHIEPGNSVDRANARLIAAAPTMYEALRYAVDNPEFDSEEFDRIARAALAAAEPRGEGGRG